MQFTPVGADLLANDTCATKGGVEKFAAYGEENYLSLAKLHVFCKDGSKWMMDYSSARTDMIKELVDLRFENARLKGQLDAAKHNECETSDDK